MNIQNDVRSRRAVLVASLGAAVAAAGQALGRPAAVRAADGDAALLGAVNSATSTTQVSSSNIGLYGVGPNVGVRGSSSTIGVLGTASPGSGVVGQSGISAPTVPERVGVYGWASTSGYAFRGDGRVRFDKVSGIATIASGTKSKTLTPGVSVTADSFVLLTPKGNIGSRRVWFTTDPAHDKITIHMSQTRSVGTKIAWLLLH